MADELGLDLEALLNERGWLRALARGLVREGEVEDLLQESWLAALSARAAPRSSLKAWFAGLARNAARGTRRRRPAEADWSALADARPAAGELLARAELQERLIAAVRGLREPYRSTVLLRYFEGLSLEELARRTGVPSSTARTHLSRALEELRGQFGRERGEVWGLLLTLAREGTAPLATVASTVWKVTLMGTLWKVGGAVVAAGLVAVLWTRLESPPERERTARAEPAAGRTAESSPGEEPAVPAPSEMRTRLAESAETMSTPEVARWSGAPLPGESVRPHQAPPTLLEVRLGAVADSFLTEEPDVDGLLSLTTTLAGAANLVPGSLTVNETNGNASGKVELGGELKGTFSIVGKDVSVDLDVWDAQARAQRVLSLTFREEDGLTRRARVTVQTYPDSEKAAHADDLSGRELIGWRAEIDPLDGATLHRTTTVIETLPSARNYVFGTGPAEGFAPRPAPGLASTGAFDAWLERCRALRGR